jgi:hypothetical protein
MLEDKNNMKKEIIERYNITSIIEKINEFHTNDIGFKLSDLMELDKKNDYYSQNIFKGYILFLLQFGYIEVFCNFGNQQYVFKAKKKIEI